MDIKELIDGIRVKQVILTLDHNQQMHKGISLSEAKTRRENLRQNLSAVHRQYQELRYRG
jgi:predicted transposase YbfD/YdcC